MGAKNRRIAVLAVLFCIAAALAGNLLHAFLEADHDCTGESCPVCARIRDAGDALKRLAGGLHCVAGIVCALLFFSVPPLFRESFHAKRTLVTAKTRLNN